MQIIPRLARVMTFSSIAMFGSLQAGVVAIYSFDGTGGNDVSGNGNNATANGTVTYSNDTPFGPGIGNSFQVTSGRNFSIPSNDPAPTTTTAISEITTQMTMSFWIKADSSSVPNWTRFVRKGTENSGDSNILINRNDATGDIVTRIDSAGTNGTHNQNRGIQSGSNQLDNNWHLVTYTYSISSLNTANAGTVMEYIDGVLVGTNTFNPGNGLFSTNPILFGSGLGGSGTSGGNWVGFMDDLGIWSNALTTGEARSIYTLAKNSTFAYDLELVTQLHSLHALGQGGGPLLLNGYTWSYVAGLSGHNAGDLYLNSSNQWVLQLTGTTGLLAVPEPARALLLCGGLLFALLRRRR